MARQFELEGDGDRAEAARLSQLLGTEGSLEALNRMLCASIAQSENAVTPEILDHLWQTTLEKLAVDQPGSRIRSA